MGFSLSSWQRLVSLCSPHCELGGYHSSWLGSSELFVEFGYRSGYNPEHIRRNLQASGFDR